MIKLDSNKLSRILGVHTPGYIRVLFKRRGWSLREPKDVIKYLLEFVDSDALNPPKE